MDGGLNSGEYAAHEVAVELGKAEPIAPPFAHDAPAAEPAKTDEQPASSEQVKKFLDAMIWQLYVGVRPRIEHWRAEEWKNDNPEELPNRLLLWIDLEAGPAELRRYSKRVADALWKP